MKKIILILSIMFLLSSCAVFKNTTISLSITGNYEDKFPYYEVNQYWLNNYGIIYSPYNNNFKLGKYIYINNY